jgi:hypothetical protein
MKTIVENYLLVDGRIIREELSSENYRWRSDYIKSKLCSSCVELDFGSFTCDLSDLRDFLVMLMATLALWFWPLTPLSNPDSIKMQLKDPKPSPIIKVFLSRRKI